MRMLRMFLFLCVWGFSHIVHAQVTLEDCRQKARENYPQARQYDLLRLSEEYTLSNAGKGNLPQISLSGKSLIKVKPPPSPLISPDLIAKDCPKTNIRQ